MLLTSDISFPMSKYGTQLSIATRFIIVSSTFNIGNYGAR